jgi:hypothetical protein
MANHPGQYYLELAIVFIVGACGTAPPSKLKGISLAEVQKISKTVGEKSSPQH